MVDFCLDEKAVCLNQNADLIMQQIDILFDTTPKEVLGSPEFGSDYEQFIWDMTASENTIKNYIETSITNNIDLLGFRLEVMVEIYYGTRNDIILVAIVLQDNDNIYKKIYTIE